jgi:predicted DCC family thiol-disulfide oxidoreductase YuxK
MQAEQSIVVDPKSPGGINSPHGLILFDGVCVLCSRGCRFVSERDRRSYFRFVPIQVAEGRPLAEQLGIDPDRPDSFAFVATGQAYVKSEAALRIARELPRWQWTWVFHFIPRVIRDAIYDLSRATAIAGSVVVTLASCRIRIVRGHRDPRRDCLTIALSEMSAYLSGFGANRTCRGQLERIESDANDPEQTLGVRREMSCWPLRTDFSRGCRG